MKMRNKRTSVAIFFFIISDILCSSLEPTFIRTKRWENGDMVTGDLSNMFRGTAGVDYPDLKSIPNTSFRCEDQVYEGGLYADVETKCQVYHVCHDGRRDSFLCGKGTIFNQQILACDYWYSAECDSAPSYYYLNSQIGNTDHKGSNRRVSNIGGHAHQYNGQNQQPCHCFRSSYKTPWSFPAGMHGRDK